MVLADAATTWEQIGVLASVVSPLVGVPLAVIALYLRAIREHQTHTADEISRRISTIETAMHDLLKGTADFEREYTTKEEWVRESMFTRQRLDKLAELMTKVQAELESGHGVAAQMARMAGAIIEGLRRLSPTGSTAFQQSHTSAAE